MGQMKIIECLNVVSEFITAVEIIVHCVQG